MVNKVILVGRLGKDPEVRNTGGGSTVANFSVATDESYKDKNGERQKKTEWHKVVVWGKQAEIAGKYLRKGSLVFIEGSLATRKWEKDGRDNYSTEINARDIRFLDTKQDKGGASHGGSSQQHDEQPEITDEDIPF